MSVEIGWKVDEKLHPEYWRTPPVVAGEHKSSDVLSVTLKELANHIAIVAQSNAGKSYFLGFLVEQLLTRTAARCVILDPNSDFRWIHRLDTDAWQQKTPGYDEHTEKGFLPLEASLKEFQDIWLPLDEIAIKSGHPGRKVSPYQEIGLAWPLVSMDMLADDLAGRERGELYECHSFVRALADIRSLCDPKLVETKHLVLDDAPGLLEEVLEQKEQRKLSRADWLWNEKLKLTADAIDAATTSLISKGSSDADMQQIRTWLELELKFLCSVLLRTRVGDYAREFYFKKALTFAHSGLFGSYAVQARPPADVKRLEVLDIPSVRDKSTQLLACHGILAAEWRRSTQLRDAALQAKQRLAELRAAAERGDTTAKETLAKYGDVFEQRARRQPTFIIIDEAHNLVPSAPREELSLAQRLVADQIRTIAAEGRKYALYLILVTQRPDKLDPAVISECANKLVMRLDSEDALNVVERFVGTINQKDRERLTDDLPQGRGMLVGPWSNACVRAEGQRFLACPARRTMEGGVNLEDGEWSKP